MERKSSVAKSICYTIGDMSSDPSTGDTGQTSLNRLWLQPRADLTISDLHMQRCCVPKSTSVHTYSDIRIQTIIFLKEKKNNCRLESVFPSRWEMSTVELGRPYRIKTSGSYLFKLDEHTNIMPRNHMCPISLPCGFASSTTFWINVFVVSEHSLKVWTFSLKS